MSTFNYYYKMISARLCDLCSNEMSRHPIIDDNNHAFCCAGCHAVYNILQTRNELFRYQETELFKQAVRSGLISNPEVYQQLQHKSPTHPSETDKCYLEIGRMWCPSCAEVIRLFLLREKGVKQCIVDYATDLACVEFYPYHISKDKIISIIAGVGYQPSLWQDRTNKAISKDLNLRFLVAAFFSMNIMMFSFPIYASFFHLEEPNQGRAFAWLSFLASLPIVFYSAWPIIQRFWSGLRVGIAGMELLIVTGVTAAMGLSCFELLKGTNHVYFDSMSVVITFVLLGKIIETKAKFSAKESLLRLHRSFPKRGRKRNSDGSHDFVPIKEIHPGDIIVALTGEKIVLDGVVIEGKGACDESLITGEAIPVPKQAENYVLSGTVLQQGWIAFKVTVSQEQTVLQKILAVVEKDIEHKTAYFRVVDPIVNWFVPIVFVLAACAGLGCWLSGNAPNEAVIRAVTVLLISCPCAIGIAAPLAESRILDGLVSLGVVVRNRGCLTLLGKETIFIFDKTGTITEGRFSVLKGVCTLSSEQKGILKGLASLSNHPICCAIAASIEEPPVKLDNVEEIVGRGMVGEYRGEQILLGSAYLLRIKGIIPPQNNPATTTVFFAMGSQILAVLHLGDQIRSEARSVIEALKPKKTILLSGDHENVVRAVAESCGFDECYWGFSPLEKREFVQKLRKNGEIVCMMGDGINDAPALTAANVGISVMTASDASIQVSDILLSTERLNVLLKMRVFAAKGRKIIQQNIFWAFFYNVVGIGLAIGGFMHPIFAAFAMVASSLIVLFNALRFRI